jgi:hypothetical protein
MLGARAATVNRSGPVKARLKIAYVAAVGDRRSPVDRARRVEALKQRLVCALPHPGLLPVAQAPPRGHARTAQLTRKMPPRDPGHQHGHDRVERHAIGHPRPACRRRLDRRQQRLDGLPHSSRTSNATTTSAQPHVS